MAITVVVFNWYVVMNLSVRYNVWLDFKALVSAQMCLQVVTSCYLS